MVPALPASTILPPGVVTRNGTQLFLAGQPYRFDGLNIYNANGYHADGPNSCWYAMNKGPALDLSLNAIGAGQEAFRAWFFQSLATTGGRRDWSAFDHTLAVAKAHHLKVIATLADQFGSCDAPGYKYLAWYRTGYKIAGDRAHTLQSYRDYVSAFVTRYQGDPTILAYQFMNEAEARTDDVICDEHAASAALAAWADDMGRLTKSIDPNRLTSSGIGNHCGGIGADYKTDHASSYIDICDYHDYGADRTPVPPLLRERIKECNALNKPLIVAEAGMTGDNTLRAQSFAAKMSAQFDAGVQGFLMWGWRDEAHGGSDLGFDIGPRDPAIALLADH
jgi:endo-1,4-beta-mannosidase